MILGLHSVYIGKNSFIYICAFKHYDYLRKQGFYISVHIF